MRKKIVFATNNKHKLSEVQNLLGDRVELLSLADIDFHGDIPETQPTIEDNARQKSQFIYKKYGLPVFADDTGLEVDALNGAPGVYSARYAGLNASDEDNCRKLLHELENEAVRNARFKTIISYIENGVERQFEGLVNGEILRSYQGEGGFGYDPIFLPNGHTMSFAQMITDQKNKISHRGKAVRKLVEFLKSN